MTYRYGVVGLLATVVTISVLLVGLVATNAGLNLTYKFARQFSPNDFSIEKLEGSLWGPLRARGVRMGMPATTDTDTGTDDSDDDSDDEARKSEPVQMFTGVNIEQLDFDWRWDRHQGSLVINAGLDGVYYAQGGEDSQPAAAPGPLALPAIELPYPVVVDELLVTRVFVNDVDQPLFDALRAQLQMRASELDITVLEVRRGDNSARLSGKVTTAAAYPLAIALAGQGQVASARTLHMQGEITGSMASLTIEQRFSGAIDGAVAGRLDNVLSAPSGELSIKLAQTDIDGLPAPWGDLTATGAVNVVGNIQRATLQGDFSVTGLVVGNRNAVAHTEFNLAYDQTAVAVENVSVSITPGDIVAGQEKSSTAGRPSGGSGVVASQHNTAAALELNVSGKVKLAAQPKVDLVSRWQLTDVSLPGTAQLLAGRGQLGLTGTFDAYHVQGEGNLSTGRWPEVVLTIAGAGNQHSFALAELRAQSGPSHLAASVDVDWRDDLSWQGTLRVSDFNPGIFWPDWPGKISGRVRSAGASTLGDAQTADAPSWLKADVDLTQWRGQLRGLPVALDGQLNIAQRDKITSFDVANLAATFGDSMFNASGGLAENWNIRFNLKSPTLQTLWPQARGRVVADLTIGGPRDQPRLGLQGAAENVGLGDVNLGKFAIDSDLDMALKGVFDVRIHGENLALAGRRWSMLNVAVDGNRQMHQLAMDLHGDVGLSLVGSGGLDDSGFWRGEIRRLRASAAPYGDWQLQHPMAVVAGAGETEFADFCLRNQVAGSLCGRADWRQKKSSGIIEFADIPLNYLQTILPGGTTLNGTVTGHLDWLSDVHGVLSGQAEVRTSTGEIILTAAEHQETLTLLPSRAAVTVDSGGLSAEVLLDIGEFGSLRGALALPEWQPGSALPGSQGVQADVQFDTRALGLLDAYVLAIDKTAGRLRGEFAVTGLLSQPQVQGFVALSDARSVVPDLGLQLTDITLRGESTPAGGLHISGALLSGEGALAIKGDVDIVNRGLSVGVKGKDVLVANTDELSVQVSPDVHLDIQGAEVRLAGRVHVPRARIEPETVAEGAVSRADDLVEIAVNGDPAEGAAQQQIYTQLELSLGENVRFEGFGLRGSMRGGLTLTAEPEKLTLGNGVLHIEDGVYVLRGKPIPIKKGRLVFNDSPVDDPGLDVRAERVVSQVTAGMRVTGTLQAPALALYSSPMLSDSDKLAYLLLGRPLLGASAGEANLLMTAATGIGLNQGEDIAKAVGTRLNLDEVRIDSEGGLQNSALVLGRYLSPRLYIRYAANLLGVGQRLQISYQLGENIELLSETGTETSADVFYTIKRDPKK